MSAHSHKLLLWAAATDRTFERAEHRGGTLIVGKCIHCRTRLTLGLDGEPGANVSLEHILPRTHGGTDAIANLAIACARCNALKGSRHDARRLDDPGLQGVIATLRARRFERYRDPPAHWTLPECPSDPAPPTAPE